MRLNILLLMVATAIFVSVGFYATAVVTGLLSIGTMIDALRVEILEEIKKNGGSE